MIAFYIIFFAIFTLFQYQNNLSAQESALKNEENLTENKNIWKGYLSLGFNQSAGNTESSQINFNMYLNRKTYNNEFEVRADTFYSSSAEKMDGQKYSGMVRYAFSFWERRWYNYYKTAYEHDRFANINLRLVPSTGIGYWKFTEPDLKLMFETGVGFEHTDFRLEREDTNETVLIPRIFFEKRLWEQFSFYNDIFAYPSLSVTGKFRVQSETGFKNSLTKQLSLWITLTNDYNSNPPENTLKNDRRILSGIRYDFE